MSEFDFIKKLENLCNIGGKSSGIGDDAAVIDNRVYTTDTSVEGVHFKLNWCTVYQSLAKCFVSNLSDVNAMGALPEFALCTLMIPSNWSNAARMSMADHLIALVQNYNVPIIGGDTVAAAGPHATWGFTLAGNLQYAPLLRKFAQPTHKVWVSESLGRSAAGLDALLHNRTVGFEDLVGYHVLPEYPAGLGHRIAQIAQKTQQKVSCIDISDGLSNELYHLSRSSNCKIVIYEDKLPVDGLVKKYCNQFKLDLFNFIWNGGEEYQLLFTAPDALGQELLNMGINVHEIGEVQSGSDVWRIDGNGKVNTVKAMSWDHF
jgi:thiamine-monophosphate kinase